MPQQRGHVGDFDLRFVAGCLRIVTYVWRRLVRLRVSHDMFVWFPQPLLTILLRLWAPLNITTCPAAWSRPWCLELAPYPHITLLTCIAGQIASCPSHSRRISALESIKLIALLLKQNFSCTYL